MGQPTERERVRLSVVFDSIGKNISQIGYQIDTHNLPIEIAALMMMMKLSDGRDLAMEILDKYAPDEIKDQIADIVNDEKAPE